MKPRTQLQGIEGPPQDFCRSPRIWVRWGARVQGPSAPGPHLCVSLSVPPSGRSGTASVPPSLSMQSQFSHPQRWRVSLRRSGQEDGEAKSFRRTRTHGFFKSLQAPDFHLPSPSRAPKSPGSSPLFSSLLRAQFSPCVRQPAQLPHPLLPDSF